MRNVPNVEPLTVEESLWLSRNAVQMLILHPNFSVPAGGWKDRRESVLVVRPDGQQLEATARFDLTHLNIKSREALMDQRWRVTISIVDKSKEEVPIGSKILVLQEV